MAHTKAGKGDDLEFCAGRGEDTVAMEGVCGSISPKHTRVPIFGGGVGMRVRDGVLKQLST